MLRNPKQVKSLKRKEIIDLLVGKEFLVSVPIVPTYKNIFKSEIEDYDLAINGISTLIDYLKDPKSKRQKKSITDLINYLDDHIKVDELQLDSGITLGGQVQAKLEKNKQLKILFQSLVVPSLSLNNDMMDDDQISYDTLKNKIKTLAHAPSDDEEKIDFIAALKALKEDHLRTRKELNAVINYMRKGSDFDRFVYPLFFKIETIKNSNGPAQKEGKISAEKKFEKIEKARFDESVQTKVDAEIEALDEEHLTNRMKSEIQNRIRNQEKMRVSNEKKANQKKYLFLTREERDNLTQEEIKKAIRKQIESNVGYHEINAINKIIKLDWFDTARNLQTTASSRHPVLAIYETTSKFLMPTQMLEEESGSRAQIERSVSDEDLSDNAPDKSMALPSIDMSSTETEEHQNKKQKRDRNDYRDYSTKLNYGLFKPVNNIPIKHPSKPSNDTKIESEMKDEIKKKRKITHTT